YGDAVVSIIVSGRREASAGSPFEEFFKEFNRQKGAGEAGGKSMPVATEKDATRLGFVIDPQGFVVTSELAIGDGAEIVARFRDGTRLKAKLIGKDAKTDVALLKVDPDKPLKAVALGASDKLAVGEEVVAFKGGASDVPGPLLSGAIA